MDIVIMLLDSMHDHKFHNQAVAEVKILVQELDNTKILVQKSEVQELDNTKTTAEAKYLINFTESRKRFELNLHCNRCNSFLFVNAVKMYQF